MSLSNFLRAFYPESNQELFLSVIHAEKSRAQARNFSTTIERIQADSAAQQILKDANRDHGIYFFVNGGGTKIKQITSFNAFFCENDEKTIIQQHDDLDNCPLPPSIRVETFKSVHAYWLISESVDAGTWIDIQKRLIQYFRADEKIKNPNRLMRLPFFNHVRYEAGEFLFKKVLLHTFNPKLKFSVEEMQSNFEKVFEAPQPKFIKNGFNDETWEGLAQELRYRISNSQSYHVEGGGWAKAKGICHDGKSNTALVVNLRSGAVFCQAGCTYERILHAFGLEKPKNLKVKMVPQREQVSKTADWLRKYKQQQTEVNS